jgi:hypothetical protein
MATRKSTEGPVHLLTGELLRAAIAAHGSTATFAQVAFVDVATVRRALKGGTLNTTTQSRLLEAARRVLPAAQFAALSQPIGDREAGLEPVEAEQLPLGTDGPTLDLVRATEALKGELLRTRRAVIDGLYPLADYPMWAGAATLQASLGPEQLQDAQLVLRLLAAEGHTPESARAMLAALAYGLIERPEPATNGVA